LKLHLYLIPRFSWAFASSKGMSLKFTKYMPFILS
jgi:hypothetical protein